MKMRGILIRFRDWMGLGGTRRKGQIATLLILFLAIVALCAAALVNISRIAIRKASVANAASGAALQLASNLGSYARMMCIQEFCKGKPCDTDHKCKFSWLAVVMLIVLIILIVIAIIFPPAWAGVGLIGAAAVGAAVSTFVSLILKTAVFDPQMYKAMNRAFEKLSQQQQFIESAVRYAFMNTVDDRAQVVDLTDLDMDGKYGFKQTRDPDPAHPGMWVRVHDKDGNDIPEDTFSRFYYKYMMRLLYLGDYGPPPPGQTLGYRDQIKAMIAKDSDFMKALVKFWKTTLDISNLIGDLPNNGNCKTAATQTDETYRYSNCIPDVNVADPGKFYFNTIANSRRVVDPWKGTLYFLFSFLGTIKTYPPSLLDEGKSSFTRNEPLYEIGCSEDAGCRLNADGRPINRWTAGIEFCAKDDNGDNVPNPSCYQSPKNDELDALAYSLNGFNRVPVDTDDQDIGFATTMIDPTVITTSGGGKAQIAGGGGDGGGGGSTQPVYLYQRVVKETHLIKNIHRILPPNNTPTSLITLLTGLHLNDDDRARIFDEWWYHQLYNRCSSGLDSEICNPSTGRTICGDICDPLQEPCEPDLSDYYDIIGGPASADEPGEAKIHDDLNTPYIQEKTWYDTVSDWIPWLESVKEDIAKAVSINEADDTIPPLVCSSTNYGSDNCATTWTGDDVQACEMCHLWALIDNAITRLKAFQTGISEFQYAVRLLRNKYDLLQCESNLNEDYLMYSKYQPKYVWDDSLGEHSVKVIVTPFKTPKLKAYSEDFFTQCVKVDAANGDVSVTVERTDEPIKGSQDTKFPGGGGFFWSFWYPKVSYTVTAHYSHKTNVMPTIVSIHKN